MCGSLWNETDFDMKLKPQRLKSRTKYLKLVNKFDFCKAEGYVGLSQKQKRRAKWLKKRLCNSLELKCKRCHHKMLIAVQRPSTRKAREQQLLGREKPAAPLVAEAPGPLKRKKKRKDKTAGLKIPKTEQQSTNVERSVPEHNNRLKELERIVKTNKDLLNSMHRNILIDPVGETRQTGSDLWTFKPKELSTKSTNNIAICRNNSVLQNCKIKEKAANNSTVTKNTRKLSSKTCLQLNGRSPNGWKNHPDFPKKGSISKTQQKNKIVQLAAMLKKCSRGDSGFNGGVDQNRLQTLLK